MRGQPVPCGLAESEVKGTQAGQEGLLEPLPHRVWLVPQSGCPMPGSWCHTARKGGIQI